MDAGYTGSVEMVEARQYTAHIRTRSEERTEKKHHPGFKARRWVVEVTLSFFNRFRKLLVRYEKKADNYLALLHFACAIIVWRILILSTGNLRISSKEKQKRTPDECFPWPLVPTTNCP